MKRLTELPTKRGEELREAFQEACNRVERSTVFDAGEALRELLPSEIDVPPGKEPSWSSLHAATLAASREHLWPKEGEHLVNLLRLRKEREEYLEKILDAEGLKLIRQIENRSPRELGPFIAENYHGEGLPPFSLKGQTWDSLLNFVRAFRPVGLTDADTLYSVLLTLRTLGKWNPRKTSSAFCRCKLCWRPVPARFMGNSEHILCQFHIYRPLESVPAQKKAYERALKIDKVGYVGKEAKAMADSLYALAPIKDGCREALVDWIAMWNADPRTAQNSMPYEVSWPEEEQLFPHLPAIATIMPEITNYPNALIEELVPIHPLADEQEQNAMLALHFMWSKNFFLFVPELARAEAWLCQCKAVHGKVYFPG